VGSALLERSAPSEVVESLSRLRPLLDCSAARFEAAVPLLEELAELVHRPDPSPAWLREVEQLLAAHGVDGAPALREARTVARCSARRSASGAQAARDLAHLRCSDARLLVRVLCDSVGNASAGLVLHVLDPLLVLRRIRDDAREHARGGSERFNLVTEYVRLFGAERASLQLCLEQNQLVRTLLERWERLPRGRALALWPVAFEGAEPSALQAWMPTAALVRWAGRRLTASGFSVARGAQEPSREIAPGGPERPSEEADLARAEPRHCAAVADLRRRFGEQLGCARHEWDRLGLDLATRIDQAAGELHLVTEGSDVLGSVVLTRRAPADAWTAAERAECAVHISGLVVDRDRAGPLIGIVVAALRRWAAERGLRRVRAEAPADHSGLIQYCCRIGFGQVREIRRDGARIRLLELPAAD